MTSTTCCHTRVILKECQSKGVVVDTWNYLVLAIFFLQFSLTFNLLLVKNCEVWNIRFGLTFVTWLYGFLPDFLVSIPNSDICVTLVAWPLDLYHSMNGSVFLLNSAAATVWEHSFECLWAGHLSSHMNFPFEQTVITWGVWELSDAINRELLAPKPADTCYNMQKSNIKLNNIKIHIKPCVFSPITIYQIKQLHRARNTFYTEVNG